MARVALVSHDVQTLLGGRAGGVGAFVTHFASLLRERGDDVTIVLTRQETFPVRVDEAWRERYRRWGIDLIELNNTPPSPDRWSDAWPLRLSEQVAPLLDGFDIAYFQDWANVAFQAVRARRFSVASRPVLVTVLHGPSAWIRAGNQQYSNLPEDLHVEFIERYSAGHSDHVLAPSRYILDWTRRQGWQFDTEPRVMGLPYRPDAAPREARVAGVLKRLVFFGRLETRKGFALFADALRLAPEVSAGLEEIVLLGYEDDPGAAARARASLAATGVPVRHVGDLDSRAAGAFLAERAQDALVVIPSPVENLPYAVIEASLIDGLNVVVSRGGGTPEILGRGAEAQLFDPHPRALAAKLAERLRDPLSPEQHGRYDYEAANRRWLDFHAEAVAHPKARTAVAIPAAERLPVDVCVTYFNKHRHFPQLLEALEQQTVQGFGVIAVDDGSTGEEARAVFDSMAAKYDSWTFFRQANAYVDAARNRAAERSHADYLLFLDADDVPAPNAVERMLEAALLSGDDCILTGGLLFSSNGAPADFQARYMPLGPNLVSGLVDPIIFGLPMILVRRQAFDAVGGYRELRGVAHEDWELQVRLLLAGFTTDVVPECLLYFRRLNDGLAATSSDFPAKQRLIDAYEEALGKAGLRGLAGATFALDRRRRQLEDELRRQSVPDSQARLQNRVRELLAKQGRTPRTTP